MLIEKISSQIDKKRYLKELGVDGGGVEILSSKMDVHLFYIKDLHVGAANILKQDALSIGADLAAPKGVITAEQKRVNAILIASTKELKLLSKKELSQPFGLKNLALEIKKYLHINERKTKIMGVINANDDSFYKESRFKDVDAIKKIESMIEDGADIIDIGALSSRPGSVQISEDEELSRVSEILTLIYDHKLFEKVKFSIDSYSPKVVKYALDCGFSMINDIRGFESDELCSLASSYNAEAVVMHMQGNPQNMQNDPHYDSVLSDISDFFDQRIKKLESFGVKDIILDVGVGFGKTVDHNLTLIKNLEHFLKFDKELLIGASRKSMIDKIVACEAKDRLPATLIIHLKAIENGASIVRVHDVKEHFQAIKVLEAIKNF